MKKLAIRVSLLALVFAVSSCNKGCVKADSKVEPAKEEAAVELQKHQEQDVKEHDTAEEKKKKGTEMDQLINEFGLKSGDNLYAQFKTDMGTIKARLFWEKAPNTVGNFVNLALGKKEWMNPKGEKTSVPLYNGTIFHRVIKGFMIQGGDPAGNGMGGPGYRFKDEFNSDLKHDKKGILSMANAGPNTNGSQFFITDAPTPHLDNRHSVFGVVEDNASLEVISKIAGTATGNADKPLKDVIIEKVSIETPNGTKG